MRPAFLAFVLLAIGQDADRRRFDDLLKQLEDESIDVRDAAAKALAAFPASADAWLKRAVEAADGERKVRILAVQCDRACRVETIRLSKAGLSDERMRAHRDFVRRLGSDESEERLSLLEEVSGVRLDPRSDDPGRADTFEVPLPASGRELALLVDSALRKPASPRLKRQVLAILDHCEHPLLARAARCLLADGEKAVREWAAEYFGNCHADQTYASKEILQLLKEGDYRGYASRLARHVDWSQSLVETIAALPNLGSDAREGLASEILHGVGERHEPVFRALLFDREPSRRHLALDYYRTHRAVKPVAELVRILDEPNQGLQLCALRALGPRAPKERLLKEAVSSSAVMRIAAIDALVSSGAPESVELVKRELQADNGRAPAWAATLADLSMREEVVAYAKRLSDDGALAPYLASIGDGPAAAATYARMMKEGPPEGARGAERNYVRVAGDEAVDVLIDLAGSGDERRRVAAAEGLWHFPTVKSQEALTALLKDLSRDVRAEASRSFQGWSGPGASEKNWTFAREPQHAQAFYNFCHLRVCIPDDACVRTALAATDVLPAAIRALLEAGTDDARRAVEARIESMADADVRRLAHSLARAGAPGPVLARILKLPNAGRDSLDRPLALLGDLAAARRSMAACLKEDDFHDIEFVRCLPSDERETIFKAGIEMAFCSDVYDREYSLWRLARAGSDAALDALIDHARHAPEPQELWQIQDLEPARVLPRVRPLAGSTDAAERRMAARLLGLMAAPADRPRLVALLKDASPLVRGQAAEALGTMGGVQSVDAIAALLEDADEGVRAEACRALAAIGAGPRDKLQAACRDPVDAVRREALLARLARGDPSCTDAVAELMKRGRRAISASQLEPLAISTAIADMLRERLKRRFDPQVAKLLARAGDKESIARLKKEETALCQGILVELGIHEHPVEVLSLLPWSSVSDAEAVLVPMNRVVDARRYQEMMTCRGERRWVGAKASDLAAVLSEFWGVPVRVDGSVRDRERGGFVPAGRGLRCVRGAVPVFDGDGITVYSFSKAREVWEKRLRK